MDTSWCASEFDALVEFGKKSRVAIGFGTMQADGSIDPAAGAQLWINCRMSHIFCLAALRGDQSAREYAEHGIQSLLTHFYDAECGGFFATLTLEGTPMGSAGTRKEGYAHAFVLLAASSGLQAKIPGAQELFDAAAAAHNRHFWEPEAGLVREAWNREFTETEPYRGINANMHTVEGLLAAWDATHDPQWLAHAGAIVAFVASHASQLNWRVGEHYSSSWEFLPDFNRERPADPFRPFGVTPGHGIEWARLTLQYWATVQAAPQQDRPSATTELLSTLPTVALQLFDRAMADGWNVDGAPGIVYTTDFSGTPIVHERMHWTACEALAASAAFTTFASLFQLGGLEKRMGITWQELAEYVRTYVIEAPGRWYHELDNANRPSGVTWPGKPDIYHAAQAMLLPDLPLTPSFAGALARRQ